MKVIVLGAGVIGTSSAYYLNRLGCEVTVVERQAVPAAETSFVANSMRRSSQRSPTRASASPERLTPRSVGAVSTILGRPAYRDAEVGITGGDRILPATARICRGPAIQIAAAENTQAPIAVQNPAA